MNTNFNKIISCEVCGNENLIPVLDLGLHPMCDDLVIVGDTRICKNTPLILFFAVLV